MSNEYEKRQCKKTSLRQRREQCESNNNYKNDAGSNPCYKDLLKSSSKEFGQAAKDIGSQLKSNYVVTTCTDAVALLRKAWGNMNRYHQYSHEAIRFAKGYEIHNEWNAREKGAFNFLPHLKWWCGGASGHIYYLRPN